MAGVARGPLGAGVRAAGTYRIICIGVITLFTQERHHCKFLVSVCVEVPHFPKYIFNKNNNNIPRLQIQC